MRARTPLMFQVTIFMQASMLFGRKAFDDADRIACTGLSKGRPFAFLPISASRPYTDGLRR
jgi:hypothetical protein